MACNRPARSQPRSLCTGSTELERRHGCWTAGRSMLPCQRPHTGAPPCVQSRTIDVPGTAQHFRYFAGWCDKIQGGFGERGASTRADANASLLRRPVHCDNGEHQPVGWVHQRAPVTVSAACSSWVGGIGAVQSGPGREPTCRLVPAHAFCQALHLPPTRLPACLLAFICRRHHPRGDRGVHGLHAEGAHWSGGADHP